MILAGRARYILIVVARPSPDAEQNAKDLQAGMAVPVRAKEFLLCVLLDYPSRRWRKVR